ncbi:Ribosomal large subunit pseudouridine synthase F [compost metagenome]
MCKELGYRVLRLERIRIMNIVLNGLERGQWRHLEQTELAELFARLSHTGDL